MELIKEAEEWVDKKYPCDGQAQRYILMGVEFCYDKVKEIIKEAEELLQSLNE